jgi:signal recognition particle receptor subunit beta
MPVFNYAARELILKIVYYGPALCGKTTNLEYIYAQLPPDKKGKMLSLATESDRTLFFDFLPIELGTVQGWKVRVQLYTVPGQVFYDATRRLVLKGADGIVFVVDSQREMLESNLESWENMKTNLTHNSLDFWSIPLVVQYNKRDLKNILPIPTLEARINERKAPYFEAVAIHGTGVMETLREAVKLTLQAVQQRIAARPETAVGGTPPEVSPPRVEPIPPPPSEVSPARVEPPPLTPSEVSPPRLEPPPPTERIPEAAPALESIAPASASEALVADFESIDEMIELQPIEEVMAPMPAVPEVPAPPPEEEPIETFETMILQEATPPPPEAPVALPPEADLSTAPPPHPSPPEGPPPPAEQPVSPPWTVDARSEPVTVEVASTTEGLHIRLTLHITLHLITRTDGPPES